MPPAKKTTKVEAADTAKELPPLKAKAKTKVAEISEVKGSGTAKPAPAMVVKSAAPAASPVTADISFEQIQVRAFEIYAGRGFTPGDPNADWLEAERQLRSGL